MIDEIMMDRQPPRSPYDNQGQVPLLLGMVLRREVLTAVINYMLGKSSPLVGLSSLD
jgi:hypothetical protein